ncbi:MAG TPA: hypothetical protein DHW39_01895 [Erysipelotrichaceae bacterium]|nr:hypothetical protein [Erysipelotrichaceae bacterium]
MKKHTEYPEVVNEYHSWDLDCHEKCTKEEWLQMVSLSERNKSIILSGMNEEEFNALMDSLKGTKEDTVVLEWQWKMLRKETYPYCVESIVHGVCRPMSVFRNEKEAVAFGNDVFFDEKNRSNHVGVQVCEGRYDYKGRLLDEIPDVKIIADWSDDESDLN